MRTAMQDEMAMAWNSFCRAMEIYWCLVLLDSWWREAWRVFFK